MELCADACSQACDYTQRIVSHVSALQQDWRDRLTARGVRRSNSAMRLIDALPSNPVLNAASAADLLTVDPRTARRSIDLLVGAGILVQRSAGRRNRVYEVESIIDTFAALARGAFQGPSLNMPPTSEVDDLEDYDDLEVALERLRDPADPVLDWDQVRHELLTSD